MINRVQAFNNKSNYQQNFGMAVTVADETARATLNRTGNLWGRMDKWLTRRTIQKISDARRDDRFVDITFHTNTGLYESRADIFSRTTGEKISQEPVVISTAYAPSDIRRSLRRLNKQAARIEKEARGDDMVAGIPTEKCTISKRGRSEIKTSS